MYQSVSFCTVTVKEKINEIQKKKGSPLPSGYG